MPNNSTIQIIKQYNGMRWNEPGFRVNDTPANRCELPDESPTAYVGWHSCDRVVSEGRGCYAVDSRDAEDEKEAKAGSVCECA